MTIKKFPIILNKKKFNIIRSQYLLPFLLILSLIVLTNCNSEDPVGPDANGFGTQTANTISAKVNGTSIQTSLVTAIISNTGVTELSMVGIFSNANPQSSISISVENPGVGTFAMKDGQYSSTDESKYFVVNENEGSGSIKIDEYTENKVTGTFEFTAIGIDAASGNPNGEQVQVTEGNFNLIPITY